MTEKLNRSLLYTYGVGDLGFVLMVSMEMYFFSAFLTDYAKFSLSLAGAVLYLTSVADIVCLISAAVFLFGYKLEDRRVLRMEEEIVARKA